MASTMDGGEEGGLTVGNMIKEIQSLKDKFKNEDEGPESPFQDLEKSTVLQEARIFSDGQVVSQAPKRCCQLITKLLHILATGETFSTSETMDVFFGVTKLFQSKDANLRRMVYLFIKEVADTCNPDDVIIVTSSLTKDMNSHEDLYRANALRVLARIIDGSMLTAIERYVKQAVVDRNGLVAASALLASHTLLPRNPDIIRRWVPEVTEALNSADAMVQFHALTLLYRLKAHDKLAVSKLVAQLSKGGGQLRSPLAVCMLIRYLARLLHEDLGATDARAAYQFLEASLRHRSETVILEAAGAICRLPGVEAADLAPAVTVLQLFLSSPKPTLRFAAMRCLSEVALKHPISVVKCNEDMEALIADPNRSIATLAITTLLKTGTEGGVDRLMKQISAFMGEIADEFRVLVVRSIRQLCLKYPQKHRVLLGFLATFLREEGGYEFKAAIVDAITGLIRELPETKEASLFHLCEFIEDCEFTALYCRILHLLGELGPATSAPARYIRFVYNRVILEKAPVRAAAVQALGKFGARCPQLRPSIVALLNRSLLDEDDEVRDRAALILKILAAEPEPPAPGPDGEEPPPVPVGSTQAEFYLTQPMPMSFAQLERSLKAYQARPSPGPLSFAALPLVEAPPEPAAPAAASAAAAGGAAGAGGPAGGGGAAAGGGGAAAAAAAGDGGEGEDPAARVYEQPALAALGRVFRSAPPTELTESETEYVVRCVRHVLEEHVVLEFRVQNTIDDQLLKQVQVAVELEDEELYRVVAEVPCPQVRYGQTGSCFVALRRDPAQEIELATLGCELRFNVVEVDPATGEPDGGPDDEGFPEEYPLEKLVLAARHYVARVSLGDFRRSWEQMGESGAAEVTENFALTKFATLGQAVAGVTEALGLQPADGTGRVAAADAEAHQLHLQGVFAPNVPVLARCLFKVHPQQGLLLQIAVRSEKAEVSQLISNSIADV